MVRIKGIKKWLICIMCSSMLLLTGCSAGSDGDEATITEITDQTNKWVEVTQNGDYDTMQNMIDGKLQEQFAPIVLYTTFTSQAPESQNCQKNALELAKYIMTRLYIEPEIEKVSVSQDKSEARVLMNWKAIDTDKVDTSALSDVVNDIVEQQYQQRKEDYDLNTEQYGEDSTRLLLQDDAFGKVFDQITKLYQDAPDKDMRGVLSFSYKTGEGYKLTGITQYMDLLYHENGTYNWDFENAQMDFDKSKAIIDGSATGENQ